MKVLEHIIEFPVGLVLGVISFMVMAVLGIAMVIPNLRRYRHMHNM